MQYQGCAGAKHQAWSFNQVMPIMFINRWAEPLFIELQNALRSVGLIGPMLGAQLEQASVFLKHTRCRCGRVIVCGGQAVKVHRRYAFQRQDESL